MKKRKISEDNEFVRNYRQSWSYIKEVRNYIFFIIGFFFLSTLTGFLFASQFSFIEPMLRELVNKTSGLGWGELLWFILKNNAQSAFFGLLFGLLLGIFPLLNAFANGVVLGYVLNKVWIASGVLEFWRLLPHGIFELPAIFISLGLGMHLGGFLFSKNKLKELSRRFYNSLKVYFLVVLPLLIIAALIESTLIYFLK